MLRNAVRPVTPDGVATAIVTAPVKPGLCTVVIAEAEPPATKLVGVGTEAVTIKSGVTVKANAGIEWVSPFPLAVRVRV